MSVAEISAVQPGFLTPAWQSSLPGPAAAPGFGSMLMAGLQSVDRSVSSADAAVTDFALGKDLPPHQVVMALENARMSLQLALQVRTRLVEGYQELMRMQL
ncbi:flagellar hook-basal body complex protein FliE [Burkholderia cepacia]|uniref:Flagellar hook-basal body complex protein FliE n=1 Tax=Burkholderia cepacia TaxID=292 RepID=A0AA89CC33_BURCE|nr:flagellar hook-basal body complex protein FliE [Burkholderia cepacia]KGB98691.1 flagellar hook-basal body complex protein FliE [Burkholderia cepacia]